jgi:phosphoribosylaminoimidazole carboxylase PurE protein
MAKAGNFVSIVMGSDSDAEIMKETSGVLAKFGIAHELRVASAHRSPKFLEKCVRDAEKRGASVFVAGAGAAAALPGAIAALTARPVLGVPIASSELKGLDALLSIAQMPAGVPVGAMAIGKAGARNAGMLAVQILALNDTKLAGNLAKHRTDQEKGVIKKDAQLRLGGARK